MRIVVFGATSPTGRVFLDACAGAGHHTTAFVRDPARLRGARADQVLVGDVFDPDEVRPAVEGAHAVLIALGLKSDRRTPLYSKGTRTITDAMRTVGVRRLLVLSEAAYTPYVVGTSNLLISTVYGVLSAPAIRERRRQDSVVAGSGLDWSVVRPGVLTDGPPTLGLVPVLVPHRSLLARTSRHDLANLLLAVLNDPRTYRQSIYP
ncbi:NAD(P)-dependent oxidoreductase [Nocardia salmonicida]|uniref:NAD(P)-dependent oxidoreductase n=1 Tax=Nocardia salmonicida TaxID=53431 RepID=UPI0036460853